LIEVVKWTFIIEYFVTFFTFSLTKEIIILPILVWFSMMQVYASYEEKYKQVENIMKFIIGSFSVFSI